MEREKKDIRIADLIYKHLRGALKGDEAEILEAWLLKPENWKFFMELKNGECLYDGVAELSETEMDPAWRQLESKMAGIRHRRWLRWSRSVAAAVVAVCVCGWALLHRGGDPVPQVQVVAASVQPEATRWQMGDTVVYLADTLKRLVLPQQDTEVGVQAEEEEEATVFHQVTTAKHDRLEVVLGDGTRVWLNGGSELRFPLRFDGGSRAVAFRGEAYFEVAKEAGRPFVVETGGASVEVLGTSFNVSAREAEECVTTLVKGKVRLTDDKTGIVVLAPGQQAVQGSTGWEVREVDTRYYTAWKEGLFAFKERPLREILAHFADYYGVRFVMAAEEKGQLTYTTVIKQYGRVEEVLRVLETVGDFRCVRVEEGVYRIE